MGLQNQFAEGFKKSFIAHLKLKGLWKELKLNETQFNLEFNPPSNWFAIRKNQEFELKYKIFSDISQTDSISKTFAQRHYMGLSDSKISENMEWLRKDAALKWELDQIAQLGPNWREHAEAMQAGADAASGQPFSAAGGGGAGTEASSIAGGVPEFGAGATPNETPAATETPEAGAQETPTAPEAQPA